MTTQTNPTATLEGFAPVVALMHKIQESGNEYPKVRLAFGDHKLVLSVAGAKSKNPGAVNLTDGGRYGESAFFGRITTGGTFQPYGDAKRLDRDAKAALWAILTRMRNGDAEAVFAEHGHATGECCMCGRPLSNAESVALGIGPICRARAFG